MNKYFAPLVVGYRGASNRHGMWEIIEYNGSKDILIRFDDTGETRIVQGVNLRSGQVTPPSYSACNFLETNLKMNRKYEEGRFSLVPTEYRNASSQMNITCCICNTVFNRKIGDFISKDGSGCPVCDKQEIVREDKFIEYITKSGEAHNHKYTYIREPLHNIYSIITVVCPYHTPYRIAIGTHMRGKGSCPECAKEEKLLLAKYPPRNGYKYIVTTSNRSVWVEHEKCGTIFCTKPSTLKKNTRFLCPSCGVQTVTFDVFKDRATEAHGDAYTYSDYISISENVTITHKECGNTFSAQAATHINGNYGKPVGCPYCATYGFSLGRPAFLYVLQAPNGYVKVGITHQEVEGRIRQISKSTRKFGWVFECKYSWGMKGEDAKRIEKLVHSDLKNKYLLPSEKFDGSGETFLDADITVVKNIIEQYL